MSTTTSIDPFAPLILIYNLITGGGGQTSLSTLSAQAFYVFINFYARFAVFSIMLSILLLVFIVVYARRYASVRAEMMRKITETDVAESATSDEALENPKWKLVQEHMNSTEPANWRLAILESDILLADLLDTMHLPGDSIGDKLKAVDASDFTTIEVAWEAHKIRNAIAHQGSDFLLTEREAKRVVNLYGSVFREFEIIS